MVVDCHALRIVLEPHRPVCPDAEAGGLRQMALNVRHLLHAVANGIQQGRAATDVIVLFRQRCNGVQRERVLT